MLEREGSNEAVARWPKQVVREWQRRQAAFEGKRVVSYRVSRERGGKDQEGVWWCGMRVKGRTRHVSRKKGTKGASGLCFLPSRSSLGQRDWRDKEGEVSRRGTALNGWRLGWLDGEVVLVVFSQTRFHVMSPQSSVIRHKQAAVWWRSAVHRPVLAAWQVVRDQPTRPTRRLSVCHRLPSS